MKSVCIIGAGPGGLVAAKTFLQSGRFKVSVYEKDDKIGGIWAFPKQLQSEGYLSPSTPTNLSKFTVAFSDLSWQSLGDGKSHVPMFPAAARVGQYLELYRDRYVPSSTIKFQHRIISADRIEHDDGHRWKVVSETRVNGGGPEPGGYPAGASTKQETAYFDYVINAAGFFSKPSITSRLIPPSKTVKEVHTSQFRELDDLFIEKSSRAGQNILVYGGGNSAGEVASNIAFQLSSSLYSTDASVDNNRFKGVKVYHVTPRPLYAIPPYVPGDRANTFMPLDLKLYELKRRQPGPIVSSSGPLKPEVSAARYTGIHASVGDQKDLGADALVTVEQTTPFAVLSESYAEFVRSGLIVPIAGRFSGYKEQDVDTVKAIVTSSDGAETYLSNIAASVVGDGYSPSASLSFLSPATKLALEYDETSTRVPIILQNCQTLHPSVPDLGFIGFYQGAYWGVMEMQARLLAARWSGTVLPTHPDESLERLRDLRQAMKEKRSDIPQYWFGDYTGYLEEISSALGLERNDSPFPNAGTGPVSPSRYLASADSHEEAIATMKELKSTLDDCMNGKFRARAAFRALQGVWQVERSIESKKAHNLSGTFTGTGTFHPRAPSKEGVDLEYLYIEEGSFTDLSGQESPASRRFVYRYVEATDTLSEWVVNPGDGVAVYRAHELEFGEVGGEDEACTARATGLRAEDNYSTDYCFEFCRVTLKGLEVKHKIGGAGEYISITTYRRPGEDS
ncbi:hypothetical protein V493_04020 [Pseudogymnoascus sp. VKM F-4281 (FW-2241)]|nr:hypothetical protein V493_04020 [Pseudogymnoascus sp. VKM F-4281 (FW-2241)]